MVADDLPDGTGLAVKVEGVGLVVVTGCSHSGLVNVVKHASELLNEGVHAIIGGFHVVKYDEEDVGETIKALRELNVAHVYSGRCTGLAAEKALATRSRALHQDDPGFRCARGLTSTWCYT